MKYKIGIVASRTYSNQYEVYNDQVGEDYIESILNVNALPIVIPCDLDKDVIKEYINLCDAFLVPGGEDVDPSLYGEKVEEKCGSFDSDYDNFQIDLIKAIFETKKPVLGICRGIQIINVVLKGTLYQDINTHIETDINHNQTNARFEASHRVDIEKGTELYNLFGESLEVNSKHHQAIKDLGEGLIVSARSSDGVIEAVEGKNYPLIAVQFHPENFIRAQDNYMKPLFKYFVEMINK